MLITTGPRWVLGRLDDGLDILKLRANTTCLLEVFAANRSTGITVYQIKAGKVRVRTFFEVDGAIVEDPVCGSGNAAVAVHIMQTEQSKHTGDSYVAEQGQAIGRDGQIFVRLGNPIQIGGHCNIVFEGAAVYSPLV